ncbi:hypothetical protein [uncultured Aliiroseovarius sp.]|uniref:hypothetical protein n=1 Tax=uncultured Aliiroseovarius sp. TaxID=1658783 RepID=UPI0026234E08|nr:hypothetical protein [uncultured Aliiroseovarius sp.]
MFHMLTCFNLKPGVAIDDFRAAYNGFVEYMKGINLVEGTGPIGERQRDTAMDTDDERDHGYFVIMSFRERAQVDEAVALLYSHEGPSEAAHKAVYSKVQNPVFICWQDIN